MKNTLVFALLISTALWSCRGGYSFTGSDPGDAETVSVANFPNNAQLIQPNLSQTFTEELKTIFVQQTNLDLVSRDGDLHFEGSITDYRVNPRNARSDEQVSQNRLTVTVNVKFTNNLEPENNFEKSFSRYRDFDASQDLSAVEDQLIEEINRELAENILNEAIVNW